ncbi:hypothetical protein SCUCBS95973_003956 [Sporothrix curviconia]|uniref:Glycosyl hydrolase family 13 catalytic domain-containing protein n=1 Tax=Sporothrix curviconia TaxID=1260050 RepID=A0ABP0BJM2_9PEZI
MASLSPNYTADILNLRRQYFVFWLPGIAPSKPPQLLLGTYDGDGIFQQLVQEDFTPANDNRAGLWLLDPKDLQPALDDGVFHYWFQLGDTKVTDPFAFTVDYGVDDMADPKARVESLQPPAVIRLRDHQLWPCDVDGSEPSKPLPPITTASNNHLVLYELPTSWAKGDTDSDDDLDVDIGTFADVQALFDSSAPGRNFASVSTVNTGAILQELGINGLELLPAADAKPRGAWGYATAHYSAPDYDLGTASELVTLVNTIHGQGTRLLTDVVMAFGHESYGTLTDSGSASVFHIDPNAEPDNPDSYQSHTTGGQLRDGFGGRPWRYIETVAGTVYDPERGQPIANGVHPSWAFHKSHLTRWMTNFGVGGLRLDSLNNVGNWDFIKAYKDRAWSLYNARSSSGGDPSRFLVIGEELSLPIAMLQQGCIDALWNENLLQRARAVLLGEGYSGEDLEWTVRKLVDCREDQLDGGSFTDGTQAINYLTSHDIEGYRKNRLYNFRLDNGITDTNDIAGRVCLAFALLLTSVGVLMIFAGEEFADQEDQSQNMAYKQTDPVNYERKDDGGWRQALFAYVTNLVRFRTSCPALGVNGTNVFHVDESRGGRIMAWQRGGGEGTQPVVVVANFSDENTPGPDYNVPNWPDQSVSGWREVTQNQDVPSEYVGREPLFAWEAKVYTYWKE